MGSQDRVFGIKWCTGKDGCCEKGEGDCDKNDDYCDGLSCDSLGAGFDKCTDEKITITCPDGSKISILKGYANDKNFLKEQCSKFWPDDDCECTTPKYPTAMKLFARFIGSCCVHDNCYEACGKSKDQCDEEFYDNLEAQCLTELSRGQSDGALKRSWPWTKLKRAMIMDRSSAQNWKTILLRLAPIIAILSCSFQ